VGKKRRPHVTVIAEVHRLKGKREGGVLKDEAWWEDGQVVAYNLAYINRRICRVDHGRVLERFHNCCVFVSAVTKPCGGVFRSDGFECRGDSLVQGVGGSGLGSA
jgi:hypothetical protein